MASDIKKESSIPAIAPKDPPKAQDPRKKADGTLKLGKKMASVFVGDDTTEPYFIHLDLLTATSNFFKKALTGEFKEKDGTVRLADESPDVFERYITWMYNGKLATSLGFNQYLDNYVFGVFLQDDNFCNAVIDCLIKDVKNRKMCPTNLAGDACLKLPPSSTFIKLLVDFWVYNNGQGDLSNAPTEFWVAVGKGLSTQASLKADTKRPWLEDKTQYHIHSEGASKCS